MYIYLSSCRQHAQNHQTPLPWEVEGRWCTVDDLVLQHCDLALVLILQPVGQLAELLRVCVCVCVCVCVFIGTTVYKMKSVDHKCGSTYNIYTRMCKLNLEC